MRVCVESECGVCVSVRGMCVLCFGVVVCCAVSLCVVLVLVLVCKCVVCVRLCVVVHAGLCVGLYVGSCVRCDVCLVCLRRGLARGKKTRVLVQNASVCAGKRRACVQHARVLPVHTEAF